MAKKNIIPGYHITPAFKKLKGRDSNERPEFRGLYQNTEDRGKKFNLTRETTGSNKIKAGDWVYLNHQNASSQLNFNHTIKKIAMEVPARNIARVGGRFKDTNVGVYLGTHGAGRVKKQWEKKYASKN